MKLSSRQETNEDETVYQPPKINVGGDAASFKGSIDFQVFINEIGMSKLKEKVEASASIALSKDQMTRLAAAKKTEQKRNAAKAMQLELYKQLNSAKNQEQDEYEMELTDPND